METRRRRMQTMLLTVLSLLSLVTAFPQGDDGRNNLEIWPQQDTQKKPIGSSVILTCRPKVEDSKLITDMEWINPWTHRVESRTASRSLTKPSMYTELNPDSNSLQLFFNSLKEEETGQYTCRAKYASQTLEKKVLVESIVAITFENAPLEQHPIKGEDFAITCKVKASPSPKVDWLYKGELIRTNSRYIIETNALRILNVQEADDGIYTCRASVEMTGELQERQIRVEVHIRPTIDEFSKILYEVTDGDVANIVCKAHGKPPPRIGWTKAIDQQNLAMTDRFAVNEVTGALTINRVHRDDESEYTCFAENEAGRAERTIQVQVIVKPKISEFVNITSSMNLDTTVVCTAHGKPPPEITFRKHVYDTPFTMGRQTENDRIVVINEPNDRAGKTEGILKISRAVRSDDGMYECIAANKGGKAFKNGHLTVEFPPSFENTPNRTTWSWEKRPVNLTCTAVSIPNATIQWTYFGDIKVERDPNCKIWGNGPTSILNIIPIDDKYYTTYRCVAINKHGQAIKEFELRRADVPRSIIQANTRDITATSFSFEIQPPGEEPDLPITSINVEYKENSQPWHSAKNRSWAPGSLYIIENLKPQTIYDFRFSATNQVGRGQWGQNIQESTHIRSKPSAPRLAIDTTGDYAPSEYSDKYELKWLAAIDNGETIDHYQIEYCQMRRFGDEYDEQRSTCREIPNVRHRSYWLKDLYSDTYYSVKVKAHNVLGYGYPGYMRFRTARGNTSVLHHHGPLITSGAIIGIVAALLIVILVIVDSVLCCTSKSGMIYYIYERSKRKPVDEEDTKLGSLYSWRFPLPYCDQKMANVAGVTAIQDSGSGKSTITLVRHTAIDEKEPLKDEKINPCVINSVIAKDSSVTFDGKQAICKNGFPAKDSSV